MQVHGPCRCTVSMHTRVRWCVNVVIPLYDGETQPILVETRENDLGCRVLILIQTK